jgi:surface protein
MKRNERAVAHLKSALRYERQGLQKKARAHFGRAMHYGASLMELPSDLLMKIVTSALDGENTGGLAQALFLAARGTGAATLESIVTGVRQFPGKTADEIHTSPFYLLYLSTLRATARRPTIELVKLLVEYKRRDSVDVDTIEEALKEIRILIISKWYLTCPYRFHDIARIHNGATSGADSETRGVCGTMIDDFIEHLKNSADHTVLRRPAIIDKIREIKGGSFKQAEITDDNIKELVRKAQEGDPVSEATYGPLCLWKTGLVTNMSRAFQDAKWKDSEWDVRLWDTRGVTSMSHAFDNCEGKIAGVEHWNVMAVRTMNGIFAEAGMFNKDISTWDTSQVDDMGYAFYGAELFNQPIGNWDTSKVEIMSMMFANASAFDQPIGKWKTGNVDYMIWMFKDARAFNRDISSWDMRKVTNTGAMFDGAINMEDKNKPRVSNAQPLA